MFEYLTCFSFIFFMITSSKNTYLFSCLDTSLTTVLKMTGFSILMPILDLLRLQRFLIEKKLRGTTSQLLLQKMVNDLTLCTKGKYVTVQEDLY